MRPGSGYAPSMHALRHHQFDVEAYLEFEVRSDARFEYCDGAILPMSGGSPRHNTIAGKAYSALDRRVGQACRAFTSDQRVGTTDGAYTYPDAMVVCGELQLTRHQGTATVHNFTLIVEVLSPSTRKYDLGEKLVHYKSSPSLKEVLFVETETVDVLRVWRTSRGWSSKRYLGLDALIPLRTLGVKLPVRELYERAFEV